MGEVNQRRMIVFWKGGSIYEDLPPLWQLAASLFYFFFLVNLTACTGATIVHSYKSWLLLYSNRVFMYLQ